MKVLTMIDSFKNTLKSTTLNRICKKYLNDSDILCDCLPIADGGENTLDSLAYQHKNLKRHYCLTYNAFFNEIKTYYLIDKKNKTAYIEIAKVVGFKINKKKNIYKASSYGVGTLILDACKNYDIRKIYICLGGSISNDMGLGLLEALGVTFYDYNNNQLKHIVLQDFDKIKKIDLLSISSLIKKIKFYILSDVRNPLIGKTGATYFFGKQKGLDINQFVYIDKLMENLAQKINPEYINHKGAGAAGGIGFAMLSVLNAKYLSGINFVLKHHNFKNKIKNYDLIITGEGQVDKQSFKGKVISGILKQAKDKNVYILCAKSTVKKENVIQIADYFSLDYSLKHPQKCFEEFFQIILNKKIKILND